MAVASPTAVLVPSLVSEQTSPGRRCLDCPTRCCFSRSQTRPAEADFLAACVAALTLTSVAAAGAARAAGCFISSAAGTAGRRVPILPSAAAFDSPPVLAFGSDARQPPALDASNVRSTPIFLPLHAAPPCVSSHPSTERVQSVPCDLTPPPPRRARPYISPSFCDRQAGSGRQGRVVFPEFPPHLFVSSMTSVARQIQARPTGTPPGGELDSCAVCAARVRAGAAAAAGPD